MQALVLASFAVACGGSRGSSTASRRQATGSPSPTTGVAPTPRQGQLSVYVSDRLACSVDLPQGWLKVEGGPNFEKTLADLRARNPKLASLAERMASQLPAGAMALRALDPAFDP